MKGWTRKLTKRKEKRCSVGFPPYHSGESDRGRALPLLLLLNSFSRWSIYARREARFVRAGIAVDSLERWTVAKGRPKEPRSNVAGCENRLGTLKLVLEPEKGEPSRGGGTAGGDNRAVGSSGAVDEGVSAASGPVRGMNSASRRREVDGLDG